jgi:DNA repair photolyase
MIVSVSRRCDIPRYQFKWFIERLDAGFCEIANPYNPHQIKRVSLLPDNAPDCVDAFVFWTREPENILANADELRKRGFRFYVMVTVTGYPAELEPSAPDISRVLTAMKKLSQKIGQDMIIWRYDPVILTSITDQYFHHRNFNLLARKLAGSIRRVIISIYDEYPAAKKRLELKEKNGVLQMLETRDILPQLLRGFAESAQAAGMEIQSYAEKENFSSFGIKCGACIDSTLINRLWGIETEGKDKNQRPYCLCCKSVDIGVYGTCNARCVYCYASH